MKKFRKILAILMVAAMLLTIMQPITSYAVASTGAFVYGSGTEDDPYLISNKYQLDNVRNELGAHYKLTCDIEFEDSDFAEGGDFYNDGAGFEPIGNSKELAFTGTFDGNGYVIKNIFINIISSSSSSSYAGVFGYNCGTIKNLGISDETISVEMKIKYAYVYVGGIVGYNDDKTISNCYNIGNIALISDAYGSNSYVGGIVGYNNYNTILNCYNSSNVTVESKSVDNEVYSGGIVGFNDYGCISNCNNAGNISATCNGSYDNFAYAGGIAGYGSKGITNCYNMGNVTSQAITFAYSGGITGGSNFETISFCYNTGNIFAKGESDAYSGGIIGDNSNTITSCYNIGNIYAQSGSNHAYAGGLAGYNDKYCTITNCYNAGNISIESSFFAALGGIAGYNAETITNCYNLGAIFSRDNYGSSVVGGIVGYDRYGSINNCYFLDVVSKGVGSVSGSSDQIITTECSSDELKNQSTFVGFDFENVWTFDDTLVFYEYPVLKDVAHYENIVYGDIDGDNELTAMDALMMKQYFVGIIGDSDIVLAITDINKDGTLNSKDLLMLKQKLAE